jgi:type IV pilus assembly protein PilB
VKLAMARLGELLVREKLISPQQLQAAYDEQKKTSGASLGASLAKLGALDEAKLLSFLSQQYRLPAIDLDTFTPEPEVVKLLSPEVALKHRIVPVARSGAVLTIATGDPSNLFAVDDVKFLTGLGVELRVATDSQLSRALVRLYQGDAPSAFDDVMSAFSDEDIAVDTSDSTAFDASGSEGADAAPVIKLVNLILTDAINRNASDIHIEPYEKSFRVRFRIDGALQEVMTPPLKLKHPVVSRLKIMAALDIAERRLPQDGRIKLKMSGTKEMDFRVSVLPTLFGEKVVMRLLDKGNLQLDMTKLGFEETALKAFKHGIHQPFGMVLVTGPTGSGKTTTLYSALSELNTVSENISTAEDPVEFNLAGINQVQMHEDIGLNFAAALRSFLRQDPDVIMVGEVRDLETCEIAIKAALTGHLVLSTLHTNDAPSTISRMLNMGVEPFLICAALNAIVAQRLVRKICSRCKEPAPPMTETQVAELQISPEALKTATFMRGKGCEACNNTGNKGRIAIYEVLSATDAIKDAILRGASSIEIKQVAVKNGFKTLRQAAISKLCEGMTTPEEVVRVTAAD